MSNKAKGYVWETSMDVTRWYIDFDTDFMKWMADDDVLNDLQEFLSEDFTIKIPDWKETSNVISFLILEFKNSDWRFEDLIQAKEKVDKFIAKEIEKRKTNALEEIFDISINARAKIKATALGEETEIKEIMCKAGLNLGKTVLGADVICSSCGAKGYIVRNINSNMLKCYHCQKENISIATLE